MAAGAQASVTGNEVGRLPKELGFAGNQPVVPSFMAGGTHVAQNLVTAVKGRGGQDLIPAPTLS